MKKRLLATGFMTVLFTASAFSGGVTPTGDSLAKNYEKDFFAGYGINQANQNQSVLLNSTSGLTSQYKSDSYNAGSSLFGLGIRKHYKTLEKGAKVYLGVEASYLHNENLNGDIQPATNLAPNIDTLRYHFKLDSAIVLLSAKAVKNNLFSALGGYLNAGIGGSYNRLSNYCETIPPGSGSAPMLAPFMSKNKFDMAFSAGLGLSKTLKMGKVELGYRYLNNGHGHLDTTSVQTSNQTIKTGMIVSHMIEARVIA